MNKMLSALAIVAIAAVSATASAADVYDVPATDSADAPSISGNAAEAPTVDAELLVHTGMVFGTEYSGAALGTSLLVRYGYLSVGAMGEVSGLLESRLALGGNAGFSAHNAQGGIDILGAAGVHRYTNVGTSLLGGDSGIDGTVPFAGIHFHGYHRIGGGHFVIGMSMLLDHDLDSFSKTYQVSDGWEGGHYKTVTHTVGSTTTSLTFDIGGVF